MRCKSGPTIKKQYIDVLKNMVDFQTVNVHDYSFIEHFPSWFQIKVDSPPSHFKYKSGSEKDSVWKTCNENSHLKKKRKRERKGGRRNQCGAWADPVQASHVVWRFMSRTAIFHFPCHHLSHRCHHHVRSWISREIVKLTAGCSLNWTRCCYCQRRPFCVSWFIFEQLKKIVKCHFYFFQSLSLIEFFYWGCVLVHNIGDVSIGNWWNSNVQFVCSTLSWGKIHEMAEMSCRWTWCIIFNVS